MKYEYQRMSSLCGIDSIFFRIFHRLSYKKVLKGYKRRVLQKYESSPVFKTQQEFRMIIVKNLNDKKVDEYLKTVNPDLVIVRCKYIFEKAIL